MAKLTAYHGTNVSFNTFDLSKTGGGGLHCGFGIFFAGSKLGAQRYAKETSKRNGGSPIVITALLTLQNPKRMSLDEFYAIGCRGESAALRAMLIDEGYDGVIAESRFSSANSEYVAFYPEQVSYV